MKAKLSFLLAAALLTQPGLAAPLQKPKKVMAPIRPTPRPMLRADRPEPAIDLSQALPGKALATLPSSAQQLKSLSSELKQGQPQLASARAKSEMLAAEAMELRRRLIATAKRIEELERARIAADLRLEKLEAENRRLSAGFVNDRVAVTKLLGVLQRLQHDMPPALAMHPNDALGAARGAMLIGASLPSVYAQAASLSRRIDALKRSRASLERERHQAADTSARLRVARGELDELLVLKEKEAAGAAQAYGSLKAQLAVIAREAADLQVLLARVRALRQNGTPQQSVVFVTAQNRGSASGLARNSLLEPVVGTVTAGGQKGNPGLSYATRPGAQVITPSDGKVLFAGPYHKMGQVLIVEITTGYDVVLAGLGRVTVRPNDQLLAGEPVGTMPAEGSDNRLYFELRHGGHGQNPAPWLKLNLRPAVGKANGT